MFHDSLRNGHDLDITFGKGYAAKGRTLPLQFPARTKNKARLWEAKFDPHGQPVDQRAEIAGWVNEFAKRGGDHWRLKMQRLRTLTSTASA